jgi:hypothetical protein
VKLVAFAFVLLMCICSCNEKYALALHRFNLSSESPHVGQLGVNFVKVNPDGSVVIEHKSRTYTAKVGEKFDAPGRIGMVSVFASDSDKQTATIGGKWCIGR